MSLKPSGEMYLESIYVLCKTKDVVRSIDVAEHMNFSKPSVCRGVGLLKNEGYINVDKDGHITLTDAGLSHAKKIYDRHTVLSQALMLLGVDKEIAEEDACKMEHIFSDESFYALKNYIKKIKKGD